MISQSSGDNERSQVHIQLQQPAQWAGYNSADSFQQSSPNPSYFYDMSLGIPVSSVIPNTNNIHSISVNSSVANIIDVNDNSLYFNNANINSIINTTADTKNQNNQLLNVANVQNNVLKSLIIPSVYRKIPSIMSSAASSVGNSSNIDLQSLQNVLKLDIPALQHSIQALNNPSIPMMNMNMIDVNLLSLPQPSNVIPFQSQAFSNFQPIIADNHVSQNYSTGDAYAQMNSFTVPLPTNNIPSQMYPVLSPLRREQLPFVYQPQSYPYQCHPYAFDNRMFYNGFMDAEPANIESRNEMNGYYEQQPTVSASETVDKQHSPSKVSTVKSKNSSSHSQTPVINQMNQSPAHVKVTHLICANGQSIALDSAGNYYNHGTFDINADPFIVSDDVLFRGLLSTIIFIEWQTTPEYASIRIHSNNNILHVPLYDLQRIRKVKVINAPLPITNNIKNDKNNNFYNIQHQRRFDSQFNGNNGNIRRNMKLNDESLMKLPHLRKHREYLKTIDINLGPKDYNSYRVSVNSKDLNNNYKKINNYQRRSGFNHRRNDKKGREDYTQSKRTDVSFEKSSLFKTELCENFMKRGRCTYGTKCHFAHGRNDIRNRWRIENYKTQPCCDPARAQSRLCLFGKRCNYAHPGEPLRRPMTEIYLDEEYTEKIINDYGNKHPFPFGIYI